MLQVFNQYKVVDIHLSAPQCDWLPASLFTTMHLQQIQEIWKSEYLLGINVKSTLHYNICRLSSQPWVRKQGRYIPDSLVRDWSRRRVNDKQHNVHMESYTGGRRGILTVRGSIWPQLALLQPRGNYCSLRHRGEGSCKLKQRVSRIKPENKS